MEVFFCGLFWFFIIALIAGIFINAVVSTPNPPKVHYKDQFILPYHLIYPSHSYKKDGYHIHCDIIVGCSDSLGHRVSPRFTGVLLARKSWVHSGIDSDGEWFYLERGVIRKYVKGGDFPEDFPKYFFDLECCNVAEDSRPIYKRVYYGFSKESLASIPSNFTGVLRTHNSLVHFLNATFNNPYCYYHIVDGEIVSIVKKCSYPDTFRKY